MLDTKLVQIVDAALADAVQRGDHHLVCHPSCTQCCIGVFAISQQDAARLREGLAALQQSDPIRAQHLNQRVAASLDRITPNFPGVLTTGILNEDDASQQAFDDFANEEPCPVLDPATGLCDLYAHRPIQCRTFGPPMRTADGNLAACELCYTEASTEEIAACTLDPAIPCLESESNAAFDAAHNTHGETLVAFALRTPTCL